MIISKCLLLKADDCLNRSEPFARLIADRYGATREVPRCFVFSMTKFIIIGVVVLIIFALAAALAAKLKSPAAGKSDDYYLRKTLFTPAERSFLGVLDSSLPPGVRVFGKVRLEDIFGVKAGLERGKRQAARNRINRKHVDFLLVRTNDLSPLAGIELDDRSHEAEDRQERDSFVDSVFANAVLPLLHVTAQKAYSPAEVKAQLATLLAPPALDR